MAGGENLQAKTEEMGCARLCCRKISKIHSASPHRIPFSLPSPPHSHHGLPFPHPLLPRPPSLMCDTIAILSISPASPPCTPPSFPLSPPGRATQVSNTCEDSPASCCDMSPTLSLTLPMHRTCGVYRRAPVSAAQAQWRAYCFPLHACRSELLDGSSCELTLMTPSARLVYK